MSPIPRRTFLKQNALLAIAALTSFFSVKIGYCAWQENHFANGLFSDSLNRLFNDRPIIDSNFIDISLPEVAENGAAVPITISSELEHIDRIYILIEKNPTPLAAEFELSAMVSVYITARIKMAESCNVVVIARQGSQLLRRQQWVNVMQGGCGTG